MTRFRMGRPVRRGVVFVEACTAIMLLGLVLTMVSVMVTGHARAVDFLVNERRAQLAAESYVERMRAGLVAVADADVTEEAGVSYEVRVTEAEGAWRPLVHVAVTARVIGKHGRIAPYCLSTYLPPLPLTEGGGP